MIQELEIIQDKTGRYSEQQKLIVEKYHSVNKNLVLSHIPTSEEFNAAQNISRGLGDTVAKITHATGLDKLAELYTELTGKPCGCSQRQEALNKLFPYGVREE